MNTDYKEYLKSPEWNARRKMKLKQADYRCQLCNEGDIELHVHHRTYEDLGNEHPEDLVVLCKNCHQKFHNSSDVAEALCNNIFLEFSRYWDLKINDPLGISKKLLINTQDPNISDSDFWDCINARNDLLGFFSGLNNDHSSAYECAAFNCFENTKPCRGLKIAEDELRKEVIWHFKIMNWWDDMSEEDRIA